MVVCLDSGLDLLSACLLLVPLYLTRTTPVKKISKLATDLSFQTERITNLLDFNIGYRIPAISKLSIPALCKKILGLRLPYRIYLGVGTLSAFYQNLNVRLNFCLLILKITE